MCSMSAQALSVAGPTRIMFDNSPARTHYVALSESGQVLSSSPAKVQEVAP